MDATLTSKRRYLILVRHASRDFDSDPEESKQSMDGWEPDIDKTKPDFNEKGLQRTLAIANRLVDELISTYESDSIRVANIFHSPHTVAEQTAKVFELAINARMQCACSISPVDLLKPDGVSAAMAVKPLQDHIGLDTFNACDVIILVGHQPGLTFLARTLVEKLPAGTLPLGGSEVACLEKHGNQNAILMWLLTEKSPELMEELKEKVKSKYDVAKFFLGAFVVNTGFVLSGEIWNVSNPFSIGLVFVGFFLTLVSLTLTAATLISYDALLMPKEFWSAASVKDQINHHIAQPKYWSVLRPPSQAQIVLFYEMVHVWTVFFIPALTCAFAAVAAFLVALAHNSLYPVEGCDVLGFEALIVIAVFATGALLLPLVFHYRQKRPNLGFED